jgi:hypothetical protein
MLSHEASIIATKERAEMKMIEFFIPRKLSLTARSNETEMSGCGKTQVTGTLPQ